MEKKKSIVEELKLDPVSINGIRLRKEDEEMLYRKLQSHLYSTGGLARYPAKKMVSRQFLAVYNIHPFRHNGQMYGWIIHHITRLFCLVFLRKSSIFKSRRQGWSVSLCLNT